jgi:hypothetical protein
LGASNEGVPHLDDAFWDRENWRNSGTESPSSQSSTFLTSPESSGSFVSPDSRQPLAQGAQLEEYRPGGNNEITPASPETGALSRENVSRAENASTTPQSSERYSDAEPEAPAKGDGPGPSPSNKKIIMAGAAGLALGFLGGSALPNNPPPLPEPTGNN